jgi:integrase
MRLRVRSLRRVVKGDLPIEFVRQELTSYGGLEVVRRYLYRLDVMARLRRAVAAVPSDYGGARLALVVVALFYVGARRLEHLRYLSGDPLIARCCGVARLPTAHTVSNWLKQFTQATLAPLLQLNHDLVVEAITKLRLPRLTVDVDGTVVCTGVKVQWAFRGFNPHHRKALSYYPLVAHLAQTGHILRLKNRPALISRWRLGQAALVAAGKAAPSSVGMRLTVLKTILKWARAGSQRYMGHDPAAEQKAPGGRAPEREILTPEEIDILLQAAPPPDDTILRLAAYSGLRRGEIFGLQWSDIDMERGTVSVHRTWVNGVLRRPKTAKSARTIDVPQPLLDDLNAYMMMYPPLGDGFGIPHPTRGAAEARRVAQGAAEETGEIVGADGATLWVAYSATPVLHDAVGCGRGGPEVREHSAGPQHHRHHGGHLHACAP